MKTIDPSDPSPDSPLNPLNPHNLNPLFHMVISLSCMARIASGEKWQDTESWANIAHRCMSPEIAECLDREPDPRNQKSKSPFVKYRLGSVTSFIECWSSPSGQKMIMITNGKRGSKRILFKLIMVRKLHGGIWMEWKETIAP